MIFDKTEIENIQSSISRNQSEGEEARENESKPMRFSQLQMKQQFVTIISSREQSIDEKSEGEELIGNEGRMQQLVNKLSGNYKISAFSKKTQDFKGLLVKEIEKNKKLSAKMYKIETENVKLRETVSLMRRKNKSLQKQCYRLNKSAVRRTFEAKRGSEDACSKSTLLCNQAQFQKQSHRLKQMMSSLSHALSSMMSRGKQNKMKKVCRSQKHRLHRQK